MTTDPRVFPTLSDDELLQEVKALAAKERSATAALIASLAELDSRRLFLAQGYSSLFVYCTKCPHLSEHAAYGRIEAGRAARRFQIILDLLADGSVTLTAICLLAPHLTVEKAHEKLRRVQDLLRHTVPNGDVAVIFDRALTLLLEQLEKQTIAVTSRPRTATAAAGRSRYVPAAVRREVRTRDGGQCAFVGAEGRCSERGFLEFHHIVPFADGGPTTAANLQLRCRAHNAHEAEAWFGAMTCKEGGEAYVTRSGPSWLLAQHRCSSVLPPNASASDDGVDR